MKTKKILSVLLALLMVLSAVPFAYAAEGETSGQCGENVYWSLDTETGELSITGSGEMTSASWSENKLLIKSVVIENGITNITDYAFSGCRNLKSIDIPKSVTSIGNWSFRDCSDLRDISIPNSISKIGNAAFWMCFTPIVIELQEGITEIPGSAFEYSGISAIKIPSTLTKIEGYAFWNCSIGSVIIPENVECICANAFGSSGPKYLSVYNPDCIIEDSISTFPGGTIICGYKDSTAQLYAEKYDRTFVELPEESYNFPTSGQCGENAFWRLDKETQTLTISGTGEVGGSGFEPAFQQTYLKEYGYIKNIIVEEGITSLADYLFENMQWVENISLPTTVEKIGVGCFIHASSLKNIIIPEKVETIEKYAFSSCTSLNDIIIPDSVKTINDYAFYWSGIRNISVPESVVHIGEKAFRSAVLKSITIYNRNCEIGRENDNFLLYSTSRVPVTIYGYKDSTAETYAKGDSYIFEALPEEEPTLPISGQIGENAFWNYDEMTQTLTVSGTGKTDELFYVPPFHHSLYQDYFIVKKVIVEEGITSLAPNLFSSMPWLDEIVLPSTLEEIGGGCFSQDFSLKSIVIPKKITNIEPVTFSECIFLEDIEFLGQIESIGYSAFERCTSLESVTLPDSVIEIEEDAFKECYNLKTINGAANIEKIGDDAFNRCFALEYFPFNSETLLKIGQYAFELCVNLKVPENALQSVKNIGRGAFIGTKLGDVTITDNKTTFEKYALGYTYAEDVMAYEEAERELTIISSRWVMSRATDPENEQKYETEMWAKQEDVKSLYVTLWYKYDIDQEANTSSYKFIPTVQTGITVSCNQNSEAHRNANRDSLKVYLLDNTHSENACGDNAYWEYNKETKTISILGSGDMWEYDTSDYIRGWENYRYDIEHVVIGDEITSIGSEAFYEFVKINSISIGRSVERIGKYAFAESPLVEEIIIPGNVKVLEEGCFGSCLSANKIEIGEGVEIIEEIAIPYLFCDLTIPATMREIGEYNFIAQSSDVIVTNKSKTAVAVQISNNEDFVVITDLSLLKQTQFYYNVVYSGYPYFNDDASTDEEFIEILNKKFGTTYISIDEFFDAFDAATMEGENALKYFTIECLENSVQHESCVENGFTHSIIDSTCDDACGKHNIYTNDIMEPTCTENGYEGGVVCLDCEKIFEAATVIPATGHTPVKTEGLRPTCTEIGFEDAIVCDVCGELLEDLKLIQATGHTDNNNDGICDSCGEKYEDFEPEPIPETFGQRIINFFKGIVDSILALFRKIFG